ncbi:uncharacterized protein LOC119976522 [Scyliorhinus canicula]|uniref:uncharacterized protein LOC119976522 n=1 Tax=Scyliorhinus canicula TaxID=7830 RepID=UPI0018F7B795|nr:uncharacterized protein LOC119976522 [Scyliorhinus canicula]
MARFLGMSGFYRKSVLAFSRLVAPLRDLLKKRKQIPVDSRVSTGIWRSKDYVNHAVSHSKYTKPFKVAFDASDGGCRFRLVSLWACDCIVFSGCFFVFRRRIDACADWIYFSLSSKFNQEQLCTNDDSFSQSEEIVYADLHLLVLPGRPGGYSPETPILTHSQDLTHAQGDCSAEPVYTQGDFSSDQNVRVDLSANLTQIQGDFVGEERSEYASLNMINNQSQN